MADYTDEAIKIGLEVIDEMILKVTPDAIIEMTDELVELAFDKDMTGAEKFEWVLGQVKPLLSWLIRAFGERLVQLVYELAVAKRV